MNKILKTVIGFTKKHTPEILTGIGVGGLITTVIFAVKATPNYHLHVDNAVAEKGDELTNVEKIKIAAKHYWPTIVMGTATAGLFISSTAVSKSRYNALIAAYALVEKTATDYQKKVEEVVDEETSNKINQALVTDRLMANDDEDVINTGYGNQEFLDMWSGQRFTSDIEHIRSVINNINAGVIDNEAVSLNDLYWQLGVRECEMGNHYGWNCYVESYEQLRARFTSVLIKDPDGKPLKSVIGVSFDPKPTLNFDLY